MNAADFEPEGERLQKVLAATGWGSRRVSEGLIADGRVTVNGEVAALGRRVDPSVDVIEVDGAPVAARPGLVHYLLYKPAGVVTTASDPQGRATVLELVPGEPRVFPVGRLDRNTEGLLILTNDGELANRLTHPSFGVEKEYLVQVDGNPSKAALARLRNGVELDDGVTQPAKVGVLERGLLRVTIHEGKNRQVRRMCSAVGYEVVNLVRTRIGPIRDSSLEPGTWRSLSASEVKKLALSTGADHEASTPTPRWAD